MPSTTARKGGRGAGAAERCELCGTRLRGASRLGHLRADHPRYTAALGLRLLAPVAFLAVAAALTALQAPVWALGLALLAGVGLMGAGLVLSVGARRAAGLRPVPGARELLSQGGVRFLVLPAALLLLVLFGQH
jgi:hypothetical protein